MREIDFIKNLREAFQLILKKPQTFQTTHHHLLADESYLSTQALQELLYNQKYSYREVDEKTLVPFKRLFEIRASRISHSPAMPAYNRHTHANQIYWRCAQIISEIADVHPIQLFYPTLVMGEHDYDHPLNRYILSDDNKTVIDVKTCLEKAMKNGRLEHTHPIHSEQILLSEKEQSRIINLNHDTRRLYNDIKHCLKHRLKKDANKLSKNIGYREPLFADGKVNLQKFVLATYFPAKIITKENIISTLVRFPSSSWKNILNFITNKSLEKLILGGKTIESLINDLDHMKPLGPQEYAARCFIFLTLYRNKLTARTEDYTSFLGQITGYGIPKQVKQDASLIPYQLFLHGIPIAEIYNKTFQQIDDDKSLTENTRWTLKNALKQGTLNKIMDQIELIGQNHKYESVANRRSFCYS